MVNIIKRLAAKLRRIILLHFELITFRFAYGRDRGPNFYDSGIYGLGIEPQNQYYPNTFKHRENTKSLLGKLNFVNLNSSEIECSKIGQDGGWGKISRRSMQ